MKIKQGFYPLTMIRHLVLTKDWAGNIIFLVTLRAGAEPFHFPSVHLNGWLWLTEDSIARVEFNRFDPVLEAITYLEQFQRLYTLPDEPIIVPDILRATEEVTISEYRDHLATLDGQPMVLEGFPQQVHDEEMISVEVRYILAKFVNEIRRGKDIYCVQDMAFPPQALFSFRDHQCTVFVMGIADMPGKDRTITKYTYDLKEYLAAISPDILQSITVVGGRQLNECEKSTNRNPVAEPKKIRNASISGMRLPIGERPRIHPKDAMIVAEFDAEFPTGKLQSLTKLHHDHYFSGYVSEARREMGRSLEPGEMPNGFYPSDKDLHGPDGELLARGIPGRGSSMAIDISQPVNFSYASELRQTVIAKTDGPIPEPISVPWSRMVSIFRMQVLGMLQEKHGMTCDEAVTYLNTHAICEDDDKLLRPLLLWAAAKPIVNPW